MPTTEILLFRKADKEIPILSWLAVLHESEPKIYEKCLTAILRLEAEGFQLRRPAADILRDGIRELRVRHKSVNYRMLYSFFGQNVAVLTHGITKEDQIPDAEINYAIAAMKLVTRDPERYTASFGE